MAYAVYPSRRTVDIDRWAHRSYTDSSDLDGLAAVHQEHAIFHTATPYEECRSQRDSPLTAHTTSGREDALSPDVRNRYLISAVWK